MRNSGNKQTKTDRGNKIKLIQDLVLGMPLKIMEIKEREKYTGCPVCIHKNRNEDFYTWPFLDLDNDTITITEEEKEQYLSDAIVFESAPD